MYRDNTGTIINGIRTARVRWRNMKQKCSDKNHSAYANCGGKGIKVCDRWMDFELFYKDTGDCPEGRVFDRIDENGDFEPNNLKWSEPQERTWNRNSNSKVKLRTKNMVKRIWDRMNTACYDKKSFAYLHGIRICGRWLTFENFLSDMGECGKGLTIQRYDITKDFTPDNCCWSTKEGMEAVQHLKGAARELRIDEINKRVVSSYSEINLKDWW